MAITRRQFIKRTGLATAGTLFGPSLFAHPFVRRALATTTDRYLIVFFLDGGNDGLNTITPIDNGGGTLRTDYESARKTGVGGLRLLPGELLTLTTSGLSGADPNTGATIGMHPGFIGVGASAGVGGLYQLYKDGKVAVIQGCGYPDYNLSHDESRKIWQTGQPYNQGGTGWVGRYLASPTLPYGGQNIPGICIEDGIPTEFKQNDTSVLAVSRLSDFNFPHDYAYSEDDQDKDDAFAALYSLAAGSSAQTIKLIGNSGSATFESTNLLPAAHNFYESSRGAFSDGYDAIDRSTARDLREIAKVIYAREAGGAPINSIEGRFFRLSNGGYDTHSDQKANDPNGQHYSLHAEVGSSLKHFFDDLTDMGVADRVTVVVYSEFARRIEQNDNGTDHGSQGPMFVIGGKVNGGVYGRHPNIAESDWNDDGNTQYRQNGHPFASTDFRDVYGTVLTKYLGMSQSDVLDPGNGVLTLDSGDPNTRWTTANFDMRRPSDNATLFKP